jgi:hypothetical protein
VLPWAEKDALDRRYLVADLVFQSFFGREPLITVRRVL